MGPISLLMRKLTGLLFSLLLALPAIAGVYEPKPGTPERAAIMEAMRGPVSKHVGTRVIFTGPLKVSGDWAVFQGDAAPAGGRPNPDAVFELELDFFALLHRAGGTWKAVHWGFAGDIGVMEEARRKYAEAPRELFQSLLPK
jgi:hypothetical protein